MKILHLTDYHFSNDGAKSLQKQKAVSAAVLKAIKEIDFDLLFFTGDLVYTGKYPKWFDLAYETLLAPIIKEKEMSSSQLIFCQGNHDVNRDEIRKPFIKYLDEEVKSEEQLNKFANFQDRDFLDTLGASSNYFKFLNSLEKQNGDYFSEMYTTHVRVVDGITFGIVSINTAWRSNGDDENKLLFPTKFINEALERISHVEKRILLHHHPFNFFKPNNLFELEDLIHNRFDMTFFGHIHKGLTSIDLTPKTGLIKIISPAALKNHQGGEIGFSLVEFNFEDSEFNIRSYLFNQRHEFFYLHPDVNKYEIPENDEIKEQNSFRKTLRKLLRKEKEIAKELFVAFGEEERTFLDVFVDPVLKKPDQEGGNGDLKLYDLELIVEDDNHYLIVGDDKCGKTSLLKKIQIDILKEYEFQKMIPFHLDLKIEKDSLNRSIFEKRVRHYFDLNTAKTKEILDQKRLILILDNYNPSIHWNTKFIEEITVFYPKCKIIATATKTAEIVYNPPNFGTKTPVLLKFENLRKKQMRALTNKWTPLDNHKTEEVISKIDSIFRQLQIPFNFWTVSLFLWVFKKSGEKSIQNNVGLVNLYIESLLERENLIKTNANFAYEKYLKLLAHLAHYLLLDHKDNTYSASEFIILNYIENYLKKNPRNKSVSSVSVWNYLKERGIFKKVDEDRFSFRLNGVFQYFLAYYMKLNPKFRNTVLEDKHFYLSFKNEFEIYAGFSRDDEEFLDQIYSKTKVIFKDINNKYSGKTLDQLLLGKAELLPNYQKKLSELSTKVRSLSFEEQDDLDGLANELDIDSETIEGVREKKPNLNQDDISSLEDALFILGRVFRNIDEIDSSRKIDEIFAYYIKTVCQWGFKIIDSSKIIDFQANYEEESDIELLYQLMSKLVPLIVQTVASDQINQKNLDGVILDRISEINELGNKKENQFELFVLLFMLVDLDLKGNKKHILEAADFITIPVLRFAILLKLNNYLVFKTNEDKDLEHFLQNAIQKENQKFSKNNDLGSLHRDFSEKKKQRLIKKNR